MGFEIIFMNIAIKIIHNIYCTNKTVMRNRANQVQIKCRWSFSVLLLDARFSCNKRSLFDFYCTLSVKTYYVKGFKISIHINGTKWYIVFRFHIIYDWNCRKLFKNTNFLLQNPFLLRWHVSVKYDVFYHFCI